MSEPQEVILKGYANLPDGPSSDIGPEYREWLAVQHPDALAVLEYLEAQASGQPQPQPAGQEAPAEAPAEQAPEPVQTVEPQEAVEAPTTNYNDEPAPVAGNDQEAQNNGY